MICVEYNQIQPCGGIRRVGVEILVTGAWRFFRADKSTVSAVGRARDQLTTQQVRGGQTDEVDTVLLATQEEWVAAAKSFADVAGEWHCNWVLWLEFLGSSAAAQLFS